MFLFLATEIDRLWIAIFTQLFSCHFFQQSSSIRKIKGEEFSVENNSFNVDILASTS